MQHQGGQSYQEGGFKGVVRTSWWPISFYRYTTSRTTQRFLPPFEFSYLNFPSFDIIRLVQHSYYDKIFLGAFFCFLSFLSQHLSSCAGECRVAGENIIHDYCFSSSTPHPTYLYGNLSSTHLSSQALSRMPVCGEGPNCLREHAADGVQNGMHCHGFLRN